MKKFIGLLSIIILVSVELLTPFTYAGDFDNSLINTGDIQEIDEQEIDIPEIVPGELGTIIEEPENPIENINQEQLSGENLSGSYTEIATGGTTQEENIEENLEGEEDTDVIIENNMVVEAIEKGFGGETEYNSEEVRGIKEHKNVKVEVYAGTGAFEETPTLVIEPLESEKETEIKKVILDYNEDTENLAEEEIEQVAEEKITEVVAFDIKFLDKEEKEVQPREGMVKVEFNYTENETLQETEEHEVKVYHLDDKDSVGNTIEEIKDMKINEPEVTENKQLEEQEVEEGTGEQKLTVIGDKFSIYTIVEQVKEEGPQATTEDQLANFVYGEISIARPMSLDATEYPNEGFTIMDRNLGASSIGVGRSALTGSYGYYYQWGNNYGFSPYKNIKTFGDPINVLDDEYKSGVFVKNQPWMDPINTLLWQNTLKQGPCPTGWHVPEPREWSDLLVYYAGYYEKENGESVYLGMSYAEYSMCNDIGPVNGFLNYFKIPFAGIISSSDASLDMESMAFLQSSALTSSPEYVNVFTAQAGGEYGVIYPADDDGYYIGAGMPVRCFKDEYSGTGNLHTITFDFNGGSGSTAAINVISGQKAQQPINPTNKKEFLGWVDEDNNDFDFSIPVTKSVTLTAKWKEVCKFKYSNYTYNSVNGVRITGFSGDNTECLTNFILPDYIGDKPVIAIGNDAFNSSPNYAGVVIDSDVIIPDTVLEIGYSAFADASINSLTLGNSIQRIYNRAFAGSHDIQGDLEIPNSVTYIGEGVFENSYNGEGSSHKLILGTGLQTIKKLAFNNNKFTKVNIPDSVTSVETNAFSNNDFTEFTIGTGLSNISDYFLRYNRQPLEIEIPNTVRTIGKEAFISSNIQKLNISEGVTSISSSAFQNNNISGELVIPNSVTSIGNSAFAYAFDSTSIDNSIVIGNGLTSLPNNSLLGNNLQKITFGNNIEIILGSAIGSQSNNLKSFLLPNSITAISEGNGNYTGYLLKNPSTVINESSIKLVRLYTYTFVDSGGKILGTGYYQSGVASDMTKLIPIEYYTDNVELTTGISSLYPTPNPGYRLRLGLPEDNIATEDLIVTGEMVKVLSVQILGVDGATTTTGAVYPTVINYDEDESFTPITPQQSEKVFVGWKFEDADEIDKNLVIDSGADGKTIIAQRANLINTVTIGTNDSSYGSVSSGALVVEYGTEISASGNKLTIGDKTIVATPKETDNQYTYYFNGWNSTCGDGENSASYDEIRYKYDGDYYFDGKNYIRTDTKLFDIENYKKDFEISFNIVSYNGGSTEEQGSFMSVMNESGSPWPGMVFRKRDRDEGQLEMVTNGGVAGNQDHAYNASTIKKIKISRKNSKIYIQINNGTDTEIYDYTNFNSFFDVPVTIGSSLNSDLDPWRYIKGTLSGIELKLINTGVANGEKIIGDCLLTANFTRVKNSYLVTFKNYDGTVLNTKTLEYGTNPQYVGSTPTKASDVQYNYSFVGWDHQLSQVTGPQVYIATYNSVPRPYTITWKDGDNNTIKEEQVAYGIIPSYNGDTIPIKTSTAKTGYTFNGSWTPEPYAVNGPETYRAQFDESINKYIVSFYNEDNSFLLSGEYEYGTTIDTIQKPVATKLSDGTYNYSFDKWEPELAAVTTGANYKATYNREYIDYTITFVDEDGRYLSGAIYHSGDTVILPEEPEKQGDAQYSYSFLRWEPTVEQVTGDMTYTAVYNSTINKYTITFKDFDERILGEEEYKYGTTTGVYQIEDPIRDGYTFNGWNPEPVTVVTGATYIATYTPNKYRITPELGTGVENVEGGGMYDYDTEVVLTGYAKEGYHFEGGETIKTFSVRIPVGDSTIIIEAIPNNYTITFQSNGGMGTKEDQEFTYDLTGILNANTYRKNGYIFAGRVDGLKGIYYPNNGNIYNVATGGIVPFIAIWIQGGDNQSKSQPAAGGGRKIERNDTNREQEHSAAEEKTKDDNQIKEENLSNLTPEGKEVLSAYEWAYKHNITTLPTLERANPEGTVKRGHLAKMVVNYATNVLGREIPEKIPSYCRWNDRKTDRESEEIKDYAVKSCALGLMGLDMEKFLPNMEVTRAQFGTIMSRLLWGKRFAGGTPYYRKHLNALKENNIMTQIENPEKRVELRQWVWLMLMRSSKDNK